MATRRSLGDISAAGVRNWSGPERLSQGREFRLPFGGLLGFAPAFVKCDNVADGDAPFIGGHLGGGGKELVRPREQQGFGVGILFARNQDGTEPVGRPGGQFRLLWQVLTEKRQRLLQVRLGFVELALLNQYPAEVEQSADRKSTRLNSRHIPLSRM